MKRKFLALALIIVITSSAFAADDANVNYKVLSSFTANYSNAKNVHWKLAASYVKASFEVDGEERTAIYDYEGELLAVSKKIELSSLPKNALASINKKYVDYKLKECVELIDVNQEKNYFLSFQNNKEQVVLKVSLEGIVSIFNVTK